MRTIRKYFPLLCLLFFSPMAWADKPVRITLMPGAAMPAGGHWGATYHSSFALGADNEIRWTEHFAAGGFLGYSFGHTDGNELKKEFKNLGLLGYGKYYFPPVGAYEFYGLAGAGVYFVNYDDDSSTPDIDDSTKRYFGVMAGAGVSRKLCGGLRVGFDLRMHKIFRQEFELLSFTPALSVGLDF